MTTDLQPFHELFLQEMEAVVTTIEESSQDYDYEKSKLIIFVRLLEKFKDAKFTREQLREIIPRIERIWGRLEEINLFLCRQILHEVMQALEQRLETTT